MFESNLKGLTEAERADCKNKQLTLQLGSPQLGKPRWLNDFGLLPAAALTWAGLQNHHKYIENGWVIQKPNGRLTYKLEEDCCAGVCNAEDGHHPNCRYYVGCFKALVGLFDSVSLFIS